VDKSVDVVYLVSTGFSTVSQRISPAQGAFPPCQVELSTSLCVSFYAPQPCQGVWQGQNRGCAPHRAIQGAMGTSGGALRLGLGGV
jgi:hypothetical protein